MVKPPARTENVTIVDILAKGPKIHCDRPHTEHPVLTAKPLNPKDVEPNHYIQQLPKTYTH